VRIRLVAAAVFVGAAIAAKVLTATTGITSAADAPGLASAAALFGTPTASPAPWNIAGTIQQMNGQFWEIQGFAVRVTPSTRVTGDVPSVGVYARAVGTVDSAGTWTATQVWVGQAATEPTSTPVPTEQTFPATATPTDPAVPTVASSPTDTPSPAATVTPLPTATIRQLQISISELLKALPPANNSKDPGPGNHGAPRLPVPHAHPAPHGHGPQDKPGRGD